jgi:hypothetical protein
MLIFFVPLLFIHFLLHCIVNLIDYSFYFLFIYLFIVVRLHFSFMAKVLVGNDG